ncbi:MAG: FAD-binding oxidoreductase [Acidimicrobiia bacterium]
MAETVRHMKWWGWGEPDVAFHHDDKPALAPFVRERIGVDLDGPPQPVLGLEGLDVPPPRIGEALLEALRRAVGPDHLDQTRLDRVVHCYGKSLRDLVRIRRGDLGRLPDVVVYPADEAEVVAVLAAAVEHDAVVIPFGGGTNIVGSLEAPRTESRPILSVDMGRMARVLDVDEASNLARIEAGALGPDLERQLNDRGWTIGHFPDSFNHSTLGGWIATRSSGMQSDKYGDIADITRGLRAVTPHGTVVVRPVPSTSTGPSVREMLLGSEGRLGIITEATVHVHRLPAQRTIIAYLYPDWSSALDAMHDIAGADLQVSVTRVSDANETAFSFATAKRAGPLSALKTAAFKTYLVRRKGFDLARMCLSFVGHEGSPAHVKATRRQVAQIAARHGGVTVGSGPGTLYDQKKFDTPYIRDFLLDRGALGDVSETAAPWARLGPLYDGVSKAAADAFAALGVRGWLMCHLSHSYHAGACLYFTFAFAPAPGVEPLDQYDVVKTAVQDAFVDNGGTLSHHHAVGREHSRWLAQDISPAGVRLLDVLFTGVDPGGHLNPGKILRDGG